MEKSKWATIDPPLDAVVPASEIPESTDIVPSEPAPTETAVEQPVSEPTVPDATVPQEYAQTVPIFDGSMDDLDDFAQTRPPDDLFSDDFEPITDPVIGEPVVPIQRIPSGPRHKKAPRQNGAARQTVSAPTNGDPNAAPTEAPRQESVRGDRSKTGGIKKTKLTEEELSQRMEAVRLNNQALEAAHARAEADEASFQAREAEDVQKRKLERQNRQQMIGEREKNRQRKINQLGGREWDADKNDEPESRGSQYRRGAHGGVAPDPRHVTNEPNGDDLSQYIYEENSRGGNRGRGRGRGAPRGRGRGRGTVPAGETTVQSVPTAMDFPSLPVTSPPAHSGGPQRIETALKKPTTQPAESTPSGAVPKSSWADEMETPIESRAKA